MPYRGSRVALRSARSRKCTFFLAVFAYLATAFSSRCWPEPCLEVGRVHAARIQGGTMLGSQHTDDANFIIIIYSVMGFQFISSACLLIDYIHL
jgi:hypothetical protein